ncbi:hypothetical protein ETI06_04740 [Macrococcoides goetzii]|nr:hypothetical protein [Macrococcus goetzii]TDM39818.1 hypothetical protein ETI10_10255 [Macrococcus goetzii]TDM46297.1 hypothetical protein ETI08_06340 [Macrococcus goetzii]TDM49783.1 hypothetical protein ETI06_04740 [Macrococcus goetzii]
MRLKKLRGKKRLFNWIAQSTIDDEQMKILNYINIYIPQFVYVFDMYHNDKVLYSFYKTMIIKAQKDFSEYKNVLYINETYPMNSQLIIQVEDYYKVDGKEEAVDKKRYILALETNFNIKFVSYKIEDEIILIARI